MSKGPASKAQQFRRQMLALLVFLIGVMSFTAPRVFSLTDLDIAEAYFFISMPLIGMAFGTALGIVHGHMIRLAAIGVAVGAILTLLLLASA